MWRKTDASGEAVSSWRDQSESEKEEKGMFMEEIEGMRSSANP